MAKKKPKIIFGDQTVTEALAPHVDEVLQCLAEILDCPGIAAAFVSDESALSDFLPGAPTGETVPDPFGKGRQVPVVTHRTAENERSLAELSRRLGISVGLDDFVYELAIRIRDRGHEPGA